MVAPINKVTPQGRSQAGIANALRGNQDLTNEIKTDSGVRSDYIAYIHDRDGVIGGNHTLGVGTTESTSVKMSGTVRYRIDGVEYTATLQETILQTGEITGSKWGAWRFMVGKTGVVTNQRATANGTSGTMAFDTEELALLSLSQIARTADTVDIGYLSIDAASSGFTPGTDDPDSGDTEVDNNTYFDVRTPKLDNGFTVAPSVGLSEGSAGNETDYAHGTVDVRTNGLNIAQVSADTDIPFAQNDIITDSGKYGGHLFVTNTAGSAVLSLAPTGIAGSAQTVNYASLVLVTADLDAVQLALPHIYTVIGRETNLTSKATFTYNSDDIDGTNGTVTWTDEEATVYDRTDTSAPGVGNAPPTIPAATTAAALDLE